VGSSNSSQPSSPTATIAGSCLGTRRASGANLRLGWSFVGPSRLAANWVKLIDNLTARPRSQLVASVPCLGGDRWLTLLQTLKRSGSLNSRCQRCALPDQRRASRGMQEPDPARSTSGPRA
jgi:hypothetical protein